MNVVMVSSGDFIEVQGTAERKPFPKNRWIHFWGWPKKVSHG
jgi:ribonuclease PH